MSEFDDQQKQWLQGFVSGIEARKAADKLASRAPGAPAAQPIGPDALQYAAQDRAVAAGGKLVAEETAKRARHPLDRWDEVVGRAEAGQFPKGIDVFLTKYQGLFYVAPAQNSFMCRLRIPNGIFNAWQMRGLADAADSFGGGYADVTTRANLQIREIGAAHAVDMLLAVQALGLTSRGSGADNIRNITGSPTAGIDPQEIYDTRPLCSAMHHYILNHREMYGLPRKFNIAFDGGGRVPVLEDTNDIGFVACQVTGGTGFEPGVYFRLQLGGITGHLDFAFETGILLKPEECVKVAGAVVRAFIAHGDRTNRLKARLKYVLDRMGREAFIAEVEKEYGSPLRRAAGAEVAPRPMADKHGHIGVYAPEAGRPQLSRPGAAGRPADVGADARPRRDLRALRQRHAPTHGVAEPADLRCRRPRRRHLHRRHQCPGPGRRGERHPARPGGLHRQCRLQVLGLEHQGPCAPARRLSRSARGSRPAHQHPSHRLPSLLRPALCRRYRPARLQGRWQGEDSVEGYHVYIGGGAASTAEQAMAREYAQSVAFDDLPPLLERLLAAWLAHRQAPGESFFEFCRRHEIAALRELADRAPLRVLAA